MIGYVTLGTNDLPRAKAFYDTLLAEMGVMSRIGVMEPGMIGVMEPVSEGCNGHPGGVKNAWFWTYSQPCSCWLPAGVSASDRSGR